MVIMIGFEVLVYLGVDMVVFNGVLFEVYVKVGDEVMVGILLVDMDLVVIE